MNKLKRFLVKVYKSESGTFLVKAKNKEQAIRKAEEGNFLDADIDCDPDDSTGYNVDEDSVEETEKEQF